MASPSADARASASSAPTSPMAIRSSGLMNSDASRTPPARAIGVAQPDRPAVLEQDQQAGAVGRDLLEHVPGRLLVEHPAALGDGLGAALGPDLEALLAGRPQADQPAHQGAERGLLVAAELARVQGLGVAVGVLAHGQSVDHAHEVVVTEPGQLLPDLAMEVGVLEPHDQQLYRSDRHDASLPCPQ